MTTKKSQTDNTMIMKLHNLLRRDGESLQKLTMTKKSKSVPAPVNIMFKKNRNIVWVFTLGSISLASNNCYKYTWHWHYLRCVERFPLAYSGVLERQKTQRKPFKHSLFRWRDTTWRRKRGNEKRWPYSFPSRIMIIFTFRNWRRPERIFCWIWMGWSSFYFPFALFQNVIQWMTVPLNFYQFAKMLWKVFDVFIRAITDKNRNDIGFCHVLYKAIKVHTEVHTNQVII